MLFWIFVAALIAGIVYNVIYDKTMVDDWCLYLGVASAFLGGFCILISLICIVCSHTGVDGKIAQNQATYESLIYQYENNIYDNDNDLGKKELMDEIREWNEDLAYYQEVQDDLWLGIYYPNVFDQFEFIEYK